MATVRIGGPGWTRRLESYVETFNSAEVNATFYKLAAPDSVKRWLDQSPPGFEFAVKASRYMTHKWRLQETARLAERFYEPLRPLADAGRMGPTLWQLPGNFRVDVYAYFNNEAEGDFALANARRLKERLGA